MIIGLRKCFVLMVGKKKQEDSQGYWDEEQKVKLGRRTFERSLLASETLR